MFKLSSSLICGLLSACALTACAQTAPPPLRQTTLPVTPLVMRTNDQEPDAANEIAAQVPKARAILDGWQAKDAQRAPRPLRMIYWDPADREPVPQYRERLSKIMFDIQNFYAFEMNRNGFGPRTFQLQKNPQDSLLDFTLVQGSKPRSEYGPDSGGEVRQDTFAALKKQGIDASKETLLIFCNLVDWDAATRTMKGAFPYNGEGTTAHGSAVQVDCPALSLDGLIDSSDADKVHNNQYGFLTLARYNSIFIGGIAHELGHALSMPHDRERPDQVNWGHSIMDTGNRTYGEDLRPIAKGDESNGHGAFLTLPDAMRLASHPSFCGSVKGIGADSNAILSNVQIKANGKQLSYSAKVTADPPVYAIEAYFDPAGNQDYNSRTTSAVPDANGDFTIRFTPFEAGKTAQLRIITLQANGAAGNAAGMEGSGFAYPYALSAGGNVDLTLWSTQQQLTTLSAAVSVKDLNAANAALKVLQDENASPLTLEIGRIQIATLGNPTEVTPAQANGDTLFLSEALPTSATVGWLAPAYNRLPDDGNSPLLIAGGQIFARGIYAHAPAQHVYDLGGKWGHFTGSVGTDQGKGGAVGFTIIADDKEVWSHKDLKEGELFSFDIPVAGVKTLKLVTDNSTDGTGSDWALWLDPTLKR